MAKKIQCAKGELKLKKEVIHLGGATQTRLHPENSDSLEGKEREKEFFRQVCEQSYSNQDTETRTALQESTGKERTAPHDVLTITREKKQYLRGKGWGGPLLRSLGRGRRKRRRKVSQ